MVLKYGGLLVVQMYRGKGVAGGKEGREGVAGGKEVRSEGGCWWYRITEGRLLLVVQ